MKSVESVCSMFFILFEFSLEWCECEQSAG